MYLTANYAYSLFYIWDSKHNRRTNKYITCYLKKGVVYYREQFPNQFYEFYNNINGYVYYIENNDSFKELSEEDLFCSEVNPKVVKADYIENVYEKIIEFENHGLVKILRFNEVSKIEQEELINMITHIILRDDLLNKGDEQASFRKFYFREAWSKAIEIDKNPASHSIKCPKCNGRVLNGICENCH